MPILNKALKNSEHLPKSDEHLRQESLLRPLQHLHKYKKIFNKMVKTLFTDSTGQKEIMHMVAKVQVEISHFERVVQDNYKIHSIKSNNVSKL